ncbi:MAG: DNRLRE domain-containing protein, partial [Bacteroidota bacterium]
IDGFDIALTTDFNVNSVTIEDLEIKNQNLLGLQIRQQVVSIRKLKSTNKVRAITADNQGSMLTLIDSELIGIGDASNTSSILYGSGAFIRNVITSGYASALQFNLNGTTPVTEIEGPNITEYVSRNGFIRLCDNLESSLSLAIKETPKISNEDTSLWVNIEDFGASITSGDDSPAIQAALNSGASTIYVPRSSFREGSYTIDSDVIVPNSVRRIIGCEGNISGLGRFVFNAGNDTIQIERFNKLGGGITRNANRVMILKSSILRSNAYTGNSAADLFLEDMLMTEITFKDINVWARQLNAESNGVAITNDGGNLWVLGLKTERRGVKVRTLNNGKTEILGALIYSTTNQTNDIMFEVVDASMTVAGIRETNFANNPYLFLVKEERNGFADTLFIGEGQAGVGGSSLPLFNAYVSEGVNREPIVDAGPDQYATNAMTFDLKGFINDDGLPNGNCNIDFVWRPIANYLYFIEDSLKEQTKISFDSSGIYQFELIANDGEFETRDTTTISIYNNKITTEDHNSDGQPSGSGGDAYIHRNNSNDNYGASQGLPVRWSPSSFHRKAYLKFDISQQTKPIKNIGLLLDVATSNTGQIEHWEYKVYGLKEVADYGTGRLNEEWDEGNNNGGLGLLNDITWNNAPGNDNSGNGLNPTFTTALGSFFTEEGQRKVYHFTSQALIDFINEDTNDLITLIIVRNVQANNVISFASKENIDRLAPSLSIGNFSKPCLIVNSTMDNGFGTLRAAVDCAQAGDVIFFDPILNLQSIKLESTIQIDKSIKISTNEEIQVEIPAILDQAIFQILNTGFLEINNLKLFNN